MPEGSGRSTDDALDELLARAVLASEAVDPASLVSPPVAVQVATAVASAPQPPTRDELRRLTIMFSDLVGSTLLSAQLDPETYRGILGRYKETCRRVIEDEFDGHLVHTRGDGMLAVFGYPTAHEDDALRAVKAGLEIHRELHKVSDEVRNKTSVGLGARIGVHRGLVYVERDTEELYGFAVNVAARVQEVAEPGTVAISEEVRRLVVDAMWTVPLDVGAMKGVDRAPLLHQVVEERPRPGRSTGRWPTPMVGRADALAALRTRLAEARDADSPLAVLVVGDPGVGKTRLVGALLDELPRGVPVLELGGSPFHRRQGLHPIRQLLDDWAQIRHDREASRQLLALRDHLHRRGLDRLLPLLAPVAGIGPEGGYEPVEADPRKLQGQIGEAVHALLVDWFDGLPGLVCVEDLHWLDDATVAALDRLIADGPAGLLVVMTSRQEAAPGGSRTHRLAVNPLSADACIELIHHHDADMPPEVAAEVVSRSDGIPLFVEELVRSRAEVGDDHEVDVHGGGSIPSALYEPLYARLNTLPGARLVVSAAAAIGRTVNLDLLALVSGVTTGELDHAVATLVEQRVLEPDHGDGRVVRFRHELVRLVAYELEPPSGRHRFHALAAEGLASGVVSSVDDWSLIAEHYRRGGQGWAATQAFERAAEDARQRGSLEEARGHFDSALDALSEIPHDVARDRREIQLRLARAFLAVSSEGFASEHAARDYQRCLELCVGDAASDEMYQTLIALWGYYVNRSDLDRAWSVSKALKGLTVGDRAWMLPPNAAGFGMIAWYQARFPEAARILEDAVASIDDIGADDSSAPSSWTMPLDPLASMHIHLALARFSVGQPNGAAAQARAARDRCEALPFPMGPFTKVYCLLLEAFIEIDRDDLLAAREVVAEARELADRHGFDAWLFWASMMERALDAHFSDDDPKAVVAEVMASIELWHAIGARVLTGSLQGLVGRVLLEADDRAGAAMAASEAMATAKETGSVARLAEAHRMLALAGPEDHVEAELLQAFELAEQQGATAVALRIAADLVRVAGPAHRVRLAETLGRFEPTAEYPELAAARALFESA